MSDKYLKINCIVLVLLALLCVCVACQKIHGETMLIADNQQGLIDVEISNSDGLNLTAVMSDVSAADEADGELTRLLAGNATPGYQHGQLPIEIKINASLTPYNFANVLMWDRLPYPNNGTTLGTQIDFYTDFTISEDGLSATLTIKQPLDYCIDVVCQYKYGNQISARLRVGYVQRETQKISLNDDAEIRKPLLINDNNTIFTYRDGGAVGGQANGALLEIKNIVIMPNSYLKTAFDALNIAGIKLKSAFAPTITPPDMQHNRIFYTFSVSVNDLILKSAGATDKDVLEAEKALKNLAAQPSMRFNAYAILELTMTGEHVDYYIPDYIEASFEVVE